MHMIQLRIIMIGVMAHQSASTIWLHLYFAGRVLELQISAGGFTWSALTADTLRKFVESDA